MLAAKRSAYVCFILAELVAIANMHELTMQEWCSNQQAAVAVHTTESCLGTTWLTYIHQHKE